LVILSEKNFVLGNDETKEVQVIFKDVESKYSPGVYTGQIVVKTETEKKEIPIILEIQSADILFATNLDVSPAYKEIVPGEKISVGVRLFNLQDTRTHQIEITYLVKNLWGEDIVSETEKIIVGTEASITKTLDLPKDLPKGSYVFAVVAKFGDSVSTSSYLFSISDKGLKFETDILTVVFSVIVFIFLFGIIFLIFYLIGERDKFFLQLRRQHLRELNAAMEKARQQEREHISRAKGIERKKVAKEFELVRRKLRKEMMERHRRQEEELRKLRRQRRRSEMQRRLEQWKKQGFDVNGLISRTRKQAKIDVKKQLEKWKKQGYDVGAVLEK
jgi:hypothetical protein